MNTAGWLELAAVIGLVIIVWGALMVGAILAFGLPAKHGDEEQEQPPAMTRVCTCYLESRAGASWRRPGPWHQRWCACRQETTEWDTHPDHWR